MPQFSEADLRSWGEAFGRRLSSGSIVTLAGPLGAGKTTLVQAIAAGLGVTISPTSPTYTYVHKYEGARGSVYHLDCYRLKHPDEAADLDWEAILTEADATLIEWPEKAGDWVPRPTTRITLAHTDDPDFRSPEVA